MTSHLWQSFAEGRYDVGFRFAQLNSSLVILLQNAITKKNLGELLYRRGIYFTRILSALLFFVKITQ